MASQKPYAVVRFIEDNNFSEIPTNWLNFDDRKQTKCWWPMKARNVTSYICNRLPPDETSWTLLDVAVEEYCGTWQGARNRAEDPHYKTTDEEHLGKGHRKKIQSGRYSPSEPNNCSQVQNNSIVKSKPMVVNISAPPTLDIQNLNALQLLPECIVESEATLDQASLNRNNYFIPGSEKESRNESPTSFTHAHVVDYENMENNNVEASSDEFIILKEQYGTLLRMIGGISVTLKSIDRRLSKLEQKTTNETSRSRFDLITDHLPLENKNDVDGFELFISTNDEALIQFQNLLRSVGGHSARDGIQRMLKKIFSDTFASLCSWKGQRNNIGVSELKVIYEIKEAIASVHNLTDVQFESIAAEWFRFAKQRVSRKNNKNN